MAAIRVSIENRGLQVDLHGGMDRVGFGDSLSEAAIADVFLRAAQAAAVDMGALDYELTKRLDAMKGGGS